MPETCNTNGGPQYHQQHKAQAHNVAAPIKVQTLKLIGLYIEQAMATLLLQLRFPPFFLLVAHKRQAAIIQAAVRTNHPMATGHRAHLASM
jgi:hypothetical protein